MAALDAKSRTFVRSADSGAIYVEPGHPLFVEGTTLMAQRFDASRGEVEGRPVPLVDGLCPTILASAAFSASRDVLAYNERGFETRLEWFDRSGTSLGSAGEPGPYVQVTLSPDGRRATVGRRRELWMLDLERG